MIRAVRSASRLRKYRNSADDAIPISRAIARKDNAAPPPEASWASATALISLVSSLRTRSRAVRGADGTAGWTADDLSNSDIQHIFAHLQSGGNKREPCS